MNKLLFYYIIRFSISYLISKLLAEKPKPPYFFKKIKNYIK